MRRRLLRKPPPMRCPKQKVRRRQWLALSKSLESFFAPSGLNIRLENERMERKFPWTLMLAAEENFWGRQRKEGRIKVEELSIVKDVPKHARDSGLRLKGRRANIDGVVGCLSILSLLA